MGDWSAGTDHEELRRRDWGDRPETDNFRRVERHSSITTTPSRSGTGRHI